MDYGVEADAGSICLVEVHVKLGLNADDTDSRVRSILCLFEFRIISVGY